MRSHIRSWFAINLAKKQESELRAWSRAGRRLSTDTPKLRPGELFVQVQREFGVGKDRDVSLVGSWLKVSLNESIGEQIRSWIANQKTFEPDSVVLNRGEVLVRVGPEHCHTCSCGMA